jgi:hypothetical protein
MFEFTTNITVFPLSAGLLRIVMSECLATIATASKVLMLVIHLGFVPYTILAADCWSFSLTMMFPSFTDCLAQSVLNPFQSGIVILAAFIIEFFLPKSIAKARSTLPFCCGVPGAKLYIKIRLDNHLMKRFVCA